MPVLADLDRAVHELWPLSGAESWDAPGLLAGDPASAVERVLLAVDAVGATADEAVETGADALIVHHPLLLRGVTAIPETRYKGAVLARLIRGGVGLLAAHTNADIVARGTSAVLSDRLGLVDAVPIETTVPATADSRALGLGRVGDLPGSISLGRLASFLAEILPPTAGGVRVAGEYERQVRRVALCAGAGDSLLAHPTVTAADVYITSDLRHHPASEASENARVGGGPALIDVSHWASEWLWLDTAAEQLRSALPGVEFIVSELRTDPWDFAVTQ